jgi:hypothetical protein
MTDEELIEGKSVIVHGQHLGGPFTGAGIVFHHNNSFVCPECCLHNGANLNLQDGQIHYCWNCHQKVRIVTQSGNLYAIKDQK